MDMSLLQRIYDLVEKKEQNLTLCRDQVGGCLQRIERRKQEAILEDIHQLFDEHEAPESDVWCEIAVQTEKNHKVFDDFVHGDDMDSITSNQNVEVWNARYVFDKMPVREITPKLVGMCVGMVPRISAWDHSFEVAEIWSIHRGIWPTGVGTKFSIQGVEEFMILRVFNKVRGIVSEILLPNFHGDMECAYEVFDKISLRAYNIKFEVSSQTLFYLISFSDGQWVQIPLCVQSLVVWHCGITKWPTGIGTILRKFRLFVYGKFLLWGNEDDAMLMIVEFFKMFAQFHSDLDGFNGVFTADLFMWPCFVERKGVINMEIEVLYQEDVVTAEPNARSTTLDTNSFRVVKIHGTCMMPYKISPSTIVVKVELSVLRTDVSTVVIILEILKNNTFVVERNIGFKLYVGRLKFMKEMKLLLVHKVLQVETKGIESMDYLFGLKFIHTYVYSPLLQLSSQWQWDPGKCWSYVHHLFMGNTMSYGMWYKELCWLRYQNLGDKVGFHEDGNRVYTVLSKSKQVHLSIGDVGWGEVEKTIILYLGGQPFVLESSYKKNKWIATKIFLLQFEIRKLGRRSWLLERFATMSISITCLARTRGYSVSTLRMVHLWRDKILLFLLKVNGNLDFCIILRNVNASSFISHSQRVHNEMRGLSTNQSRDIGENACLKVSRSIKPCIGLWITLQFCTWNQSKVWIIAWMVDNFCFMKKQLAYGSCPYFSGCISVICLILEDKDHFKLGVLIRSKLYGLSPISYMLVLVHKRPKLRGIIVIMFPLLLYVAESTE